MERFYKWLPYSRRPLMRDVIRLDRTRRNETAMSESDPDPYETMLLILSAFAAAIQHFDERLSEASMRAGFDFSPLTNGLSSIESKDEDFGGLYWNVASVITHDSGCRTRASVELGIDHNDASFAPVSGHLEYENKNGFERFFRIGRRVEHLNQLELTSLTVVDQLFRQIDDGLTESLALAKESRG